MGELGSRIRVERESRVLRIVLIRPERGNAIDPEFVEELWTAVSQLEGGVRCIALVAEGRRSAWEAMSASSPRHLSREYLCRVGRPGCTRPCSP